MSEVSDVVHVEVDAPLLGEWLYVDEEGHPQRDYQEGYPVWCIDDSMEFDNLQVLSGTYSGGFEWSAWDEGSEVCIKPTRYMRLPIC